MKKVFSIIATALVCAVMLVSCAKSNFQNELDSMTKALEAKDYAKVVEGANTIINGTDKAAAGDLVSAGTMLNSVVSLKQADGQLDNQEAIDLLNKAVTALNSAKAKSDYDATVATFKAANVDVEAIAAQLPNAVATFQAAIDAAAQQAEATEGEAEGEAEGEGEAEATEAE